MPDLRLLCGLFALTACGALQALPSETCGNLVVEGAEQCDGQPGCGTTGPAACRFTCEVGVTGCPGELACSVEGVCVASAGSFVPYALAPHYELPADRIVVGDLDGDGRDDAVGLGESLRVRFGARSEPLLASYEKRIRPPTGPAAFGELDDRPGLDVVFPTASGVYTLVARGRELDAVPYASVHALPDDSAGACTPSPGWAACRAIDLDRDGVVDRIGFVAGRDNLEIELGRRAGPAVRVTFDTLDVITDLTSGDFDGDGFGDLAFATRSVNGVASQAVHVVYGAPQPEAFRAVLVATADQIAGIAAGDLSTPRDGLDDLAVARGGRSAGVAVYLGDSSRDLSAPFVLDGGRFGEDIPYAVVAGEFVGGRGSGVDVMAYARNPAEPGRTFFWWLRGLGNAQLSLEIVDQIDATQVDFLDTAWSVGDLVADLSTAQNGPDEVIGLSPIAPGCRGPALTAAVPSARNTGSALVRSACLQVDGDAWQPELVGVLYGSASRTVASRAVAIARRDRAWWIGKAARLDDATANAALPGSATVLDAECRDPQLWPQLADVATFVSVACDGPGGTSIVGLRQDRDAATATPTQLVTVPRGADHQVGDFNGDGLTDLLVREGNVITVMLQCSADLAGTPGC